MATIIGLFITLFLTIANIFLPSLRTAENPPQTAQEQKHPTISIDDSFTAHSILVFGIHGEDILANYHADEERPIASLSKIMTTYVALSHLDLQDSVTLSKEAVETPGVVGDFRAGETFTFKNALYATMMMSSNDMAMAIAETVGKKLGGATYDDRINLFVDEMNKTSQRLGMAHTIFRNPTGLDTAPGIASNYSTAEDLATLIKATQKTPFLWEASREENQTIVSSEGITHHIFNLDKIIDTVPHFIGSKTGTTDTSGESLVVLYEYPLGTPYGMILLGANAGRRFPEASDLLQKTLSVLK